MGENRREFLKHFGGLTAAAVAVPALTACGARGEASSAATPGRNGGRPALAANGEATTESLPAPALRCALELDGSFAGWLRSFEGGNYVGEVSRLATSSGSTQPAQLTSVDFEDLVLGCGTAMTNALGAWIASLLALKHQYRNGAVVAVDGDGREQARLEFTNALLSEVTLPALDVASNAPVRMTVKIRAEQVHRLSGSGRPVTFPPALPDRRWLASDFQVAIAGLDASAVATVGGITVKQGIKRDEVGAQRIKALVPGKIDIPNLELAVTGASAQPFSDWAEDFIWNGNCGQDAERSGAITFLDSSRAPLFTLGLQNVGIMRAAPDGFDADAPVAVRRTHVKLYCEAMTLDASGTWG